MARRGTKARIRRIAADEARALVESALAAGGMNDADAAAVADVLIEAELTGRASHGLMRAPGLCRTASKAHPAEPEAVRDTASSALLDAKGMTGYLAAVRAVDLASEKAASAGVGLVGVRNTTHAGFMGYYVTRGAKRGMITAVCADTFPRIAPTGSTEALLGTNPLAVAFPCDPHPIVVDMSTASVTNGALMVMRGLGMKLPPGLAMDPGGMATEDPSEALAGAVVPFGGPKGYCLALVVQILSTAFLGGELIPERGGKYGILALAADPGLFTSRESFAAEMGSLRERIKALRTEKPDAEILLPGERAAREREQRIAEGIDVPEELMAELGRLGRG